MIDGILTSVKKQLGIDETYNHFDDDIIINTNVVFQILYQMGVGPEKGFYIENEDTTWSDYTTDLALQHLVKTYIFLKVKTMFDPSANSVVVGSYDRTIAELEWRLRYHVETNSSM